MPSLFSSKRKPPVRVGIVGLGYWGPNVLRNFLSSPDAMVTAVCDKDQKKLNIVQHRDILKTTDHEELLESNKIDAVVLCVPIHAHYPLAKKAIEAKKHVWVEKPLTDTTEQALELCSLADKKGVTLFVDHTFVYNPAVRKMKEIIDQGLLGDLFYFDSTRVNLGLFQQDVNVVWDLAPHDLSILNYLVGMMPSKVSAIGAAHFTQDKEEIAYVHLYYENNMLAHLNFNWLSPVKVRKILVGGSQRLLLYDDTDAAEKIKLYDKGVDINGKLSQEGKEKYLINYRMGDMIAPCIENVEPLSLACRDFIDAILNQKSPLSDGKKGAKIVQIIEAIQQSLKMQGREVPLPPL